MSKKKNDRQLDKVPSLGSELVPYSISPFDGRIPYKVFPNWEFLGTGPQ
jgi:hypothetical protein